jgi:1-aminocyclopropane-1-carboxylate deaminase
LPLPTDWTPHAPLQPLRLGWAAAAGIELAVLRLDLVDSLISGNKGFKLVPWLAQARAEGCQGLIGLGGTHSNHLHALAAASRRFGFPSVGLLRGEPRDTPTVRDLQAWGMRLHWLGYGGYRARHAADFWERWRDRYPDLLGMPEGGGGLTGARGCECLVQLARQQIAALGWPGYDGWWLAAGTGTTLAGLVLAERGEHPVFGALAVPADHGTAEQVRAILAADGRPEAGYRLLEASRAGFGRWDDELLRFMRDTELESGVPLEPVYTAKALLALRERVAAGELRPGMRIVFVHTGGLQGRRGLAC